MNTIWLLLQGENTHVLSIQLILQELYFVKKVEEKGKKFGIISAITPNTVRYRRWREKKLVEAEG